MTDLKRDLINIHKIAGLLGKDWSPPQPFGDDGWYIEGTLKRVFVSLDDITDPGTSWIHASISHADRKRMPSYGELKQMHRAVFGSGYAYQCFVPPDSHVNITANVLHLFGRLDGLPVLPNFGRLGTI